MYLSKILPFRFFMFDFYHISVIMTSKDPPNNFFFFLLLILVFIYLFIYFWVNWKFTWRKRKYKAFIQIFEAKTEVHEVSPLAVTRTCLFKSTRLFPSPLGAARHRPLSLRLHRRADWPAALIRDLSADCRIYWSTSAGSLKASSSGQNAGDQMCGGGRRVRAQTHGGRRVFTPVESPRMDEWWEDAM